MDQINAMAVSQTLFFFFFSLPYLEEVIAWWDISNIDPLAVDVMTVHVPASHCDSLFTKIGAFVLFLHI